MSDIVHTEEIPATVSAWIEQAPREVAFSAGISHPHNSKIGQYGYSKSRHPSGIVEMRDRSSIDLTVGEKASGLILACRSVPKTPARVIWLGGTGLEMTTGDRI